MIEDTSIYIMTEKEKTYTRRRTERKAKHKYKE
jgi:hypothetical protein